MAKKITKKTVKKVTKKVVKKVTKKPSKKIKNVAPKLPPIGELAPEFCLKNQDGKEISLKSLRGKFVVLYFYPRAMTPGCTVQACGIRDIKKELAKNNIVVLGISPDSQKSLIKFIERDKLNFDLLSDEDHGVALQYGSWGQKQFMGKTFDGILRQSFFIGKDGILLSIMPKVDTKSHAEDILSFFQNIK